MTKSTADPTRNPTRWLAISSPSIDIATAWAKLDRAAKAIRLRFADGFRTGDQQENAERHVKGGLASWCRLYPNQPDGIKEPMSG
jgi:hypothetical protein